MALSVKDMGRSGAIGRLTYERKAVVVGVVQALMVRFDLSEADVSAVLDEVLEQRRQAGLPAGREDGDGRL